MHSAYTPHLRRCVSSIISCSDILEKPLAGSIYTTRSSLPLMGRPINFPYTPGVREALGDKSMKDVATPAEHLHQAAWLPICMGSTSPLRGRSGDNAPLHTHKCHILGRNQFGLLFRFLLRSTAGCALTYVVLPVAFSLPPPPSLVEII